MPAITTDPAVMLGKPVIAGTWITVELILERLAAGHSADQIMDSYPHLPAGSVRAAVEYTIAAIRHEIIVPPIRQTLL